MTSTDRDRGKHNLAVSCAGVTLAAMVISLVYRYTTPPKLYDRAVPIWLGGLATFCALITLGAEYSRQRLRLFIVLMAVLWLSIILPILLVPPS